MNLIPRQAHPDDFDEVFSVCFPHASDCVRLRRQVRREWDVFFSYPTSLSMVVEGGCGSGRSTLGFAQTVFVSDSFVAHLRAGAPPYANSLAIQPLPDGTQPLLQENEVRAANTTGGLNALTTRWSWAEVGFSYAEQRRIREFMDAAYPLFYSGYKYKMHLIGATGDWACQALVASGFRVLDDYCGRPESRLPDEQRPWLLCLSQQEARLNEGSHASRLFNYSAPRYGFSSGDQQVLFQALMGHCDAEIADMLHLSREAVKKRWARIFLRVSSVDHELMPARDSAVRGREKRTVLLGHLRMHLHELRPVLSPYATKPQPRCQEPAASRAACRGVSSAYQTL